MTSRIYLAIVSAMLALSLGAQQFRPTPRGLDSIVGQSTADRAVEATESKRALIQLEASTDDSNATIKTGWTISEKSDAKVGVFDTFSLAATAPLSKGGPTSLVSINGFPNAFTVSGKYTRYLLKTANPFGNPSTQREFVALCDEVELKTISDEEKALIEIALQLGKSKEDARIFARERVKEVKEKLRAERRAELIAIARDLGKSDSEATEFADTQLAREEGEFQCDTGAVTKVAPELLPKFNDLFWDRSSTHWFWGTSGTIGRRTFDYLQADLSDGSTSKTPWGASVFGAALPGGMSTLFTAGFEHRDKYKDADEQTLCPQDSTATQLKCKTGPLGGPVDVTEELAFVEMRRFVGSRAMSLKIAYDFEADNLSLDVPIYIIPTGDSGLAGGVRVGWAENEGAQLSVFVTSAFKLFPN